MIVVVARSQEAGAAFVRRNACLVDDISLEVGQRSYFRLLQDIIDTATQSVVCVVHDDVFLPGDFNLRIAELVRELGVEWPNWGVVGNAGICPFGAGYDGGQVIRYLFDTHGGPNIRGGIYPAFGIDGNVMLLNVAALRRAGVRLPAFDGFQLYDVSLSIETIVSGLAVLVAPQLACFHQSGGGQTDFDTASSSDGFRKYLASRLSNTRIQTLNGVIYASRYQESDGVRQRGIDLVLESMRVAAVGRKTREVAIVVRTQFKRIDLLTRALRTIDAFRVAARDSSIFHTYIVTDCVPSEAFESGSDLRVLRCMDEFSGDSRFALVRFAAENIDAEYLWFIDDDDWLFPNEAESLGLLVNISPRNSTIFVRSQQFREKETPFGDERSAARYRSTAARAFCPNDFFNSFGGDNHVPFCGALFRRDSLRALPKDAASRITYFEDYFCFFWSLLTGNVVPVTLDRLLVGISVRDTGNTITLGDRSEWNRSLGELATFVCNAPEGPDLFSAYARCSRNRHHGSQTSYAALQEELASVYASTSWRVSRPLRAVKMAIVAVRKSFGGR